MPAISLIAALRGGPSAGRIWAVIGAGAIPGTAVEPVTWRCTSVHHDGQVPDRLRGVHRGHARGFRRSWASLRGVVTLSGSVTYAAARTIAQSVPGVNVVSDEIAHAYAWDCVLERRPWGFTLSDVGAHVDVWQGGQDRAVPAFQATALVGGVKDSRLLMIPEAGHGLILAHGRRY